MMGGASSSGYSTGTSTRQPTEKMRGKYAKGLDPSQAMGLTLRPTAMLPRVYPGLSAADPAYQRLSELPAAQLAMLTGYKGTPRSLANSVGRIYQRAGAGDLPSTRKLMKGLTGGKGIDQMFSGVKAGRGDMASYTSPGYVYGQEPMPMGEAAGTLASLLDAALINEPLRTQQKYGSAPGSWGQFLIDKGSMKSMKKPAGKGVPLNKFVGRRLFR